MKKLTPSPKFEIFLLGRVLFINFLIESVFWYAVCSGNYYFLHNNSFFLILFNKEMLDGCRPRHATRTIQIHTFYNLRPSQLDFIRNREDEIFDCRFVEYIYNNVIFHNINFTLAKPQFNLCARIAPIPPLKINV